MKIIAITEFETSEGTGSNTEIKLDQRNGLYFCVVGGTFKTTLFTKDQSVIPVIMRHGDREQTNISFSIKGNLLTMNQGYRQADNCYLIVYANDDFADTSELIPVVLDSLEINKVVLSNGTDVNVLSGINGVKIRLRSSGFTPTGTGYNSQEVITHDNKVYILPISWVTHSVNPNTGEYDYIRADIDRAVTAYIKPYPPVEMKG